MNICENKLPNINNLPLLARPVLHYSMFGVAPRNIIGESAFRKIKKEVQLRADHHCEICGRYVTHNNITKDWLHTHEVYQVDHKRRIYCFERYIGICKECHEFIHLGYLDRVAKSLHEQGVNIIHYDGVNKVLPDEFFYKPKKRKG